MGFEGFLDQIFYKEATEFLLEDYPEKLVVRVLRLYSLYSLNTIEELGASIGTSIKKKEGKTDLNKELSQFSVSEVSKEKDKVELIMCPFCRGKKSRKPMCRFVTGFIKGFLNLPENAVKETHCFACGDFVCAFKIDV
jgi:predicted hydrocarbon binding protein